MGWEEMRSWPPVRQVAGFISIRWRRGQEQIFRTTFLFLFRSRSERRPGIKCSSIMILALAVNEDRAATNHEFSWAKIGIQSSRLFDWYHHIVHVGAGVVKHLCRRNDPPPTSHGALSSNPVNFCLENSRTSDWTNRTVLDVDSTASMMRTCSFVPRLQRPYRGYACSKRFLRLASVVADWSKEFGL